MVVRVHRGTAVLRTNAEPAVAACFTDRDVFMFQIADFTDRRAAIHMNLAKLAGRHAEQGVIAFLCHELCRNTGAADKLGSFADLEFNVMNGRTNRNVLQRKRIANLDVRFRTRNDLIADVQSVRCKNITLLTINIVEERNAGAAVRIVFNRSDTSRNPVLVAFEIDNAIKALMSAALMANGQTALLIAAAFFGQAFRQGFLRLACRNFIERSDGHETAACRIWFKTLYCHLNLPPFLYYASKNSMLSPAASFTMAFL